MRCSACSDVILKINYLGKSCQDSRISLILLEMLVAGEDRRFRSHCGFDLKAFIRAIWKSFMGQGVEGGSTIAMQLVRVASGRYERTIFRKLFEIQCAIRITSLFERDDILKVYLGVAYFGWRMNGIEQAAKRLGLAIDAINARQAAELVARLKYPEGANPSQRRLEQIKGRASYILGVHGLIFGG